MAKDNQNSPFNIHKEQGKDTDKKTQLEQVYQAFYSSPKTMKEVTVLTGVLREFVCWRCRDLRLAKQLFFTKIRRCTVTGQMVKEWTTDPTKAPDLSNQLTLF